MLMITVRLTTSYYPVLSKTKVAALTHYRAGLIVSYFIIFFIIEKISLTFLIEAMLK